jgi:hypothetical protein
MNSSLIGNVRSAMLERRIDKIGLRAGIIAVALVLPFNMALSGQAGNVGLESVGLLTIETGSDRVALYNGGEFGV